MRRVPLGPRPALVLASTLAVVLFLLDTTVPWAHFWTCYLLPSLLISLWGRQRDIYIVTALGSVLLVASYRFDQSLGLGDHLIDRLAPLAVLWGAAWLLARHQQLQAQLARREQELEEQVRARTAALAASERKWHSVFEFVPVGLSVVDKQHQVTDTNPALSQIIGMTPADILQRQYARRRYFRPDLSPMPPEEFPSVRALRERQTVRDVTIGVEKEDGEIIWVSVSATPESIEGLALIVTADISEHKRLEQALQALNEELEGRVAARTSDLQAALTELQAANHLKDEFMAMISHELRTPLTGVLSLSELLEEEVAGPLNARQATYVKGIVESGERLLNVINGILGYTHLLAGKVRLQAAPCELAGLLDICAASQEQQAAAKRQSIAVAVAPPDLAVTADTAALAEVIKRLLDNAVKFTPVGGCIGLEARRAAQAAHYGTGLQPGVDLVVWDTGIGIAATQLDHIRKPFTQADAGLARCHEGLGLGLAYVDQMVHLLGGTLTVESKLGAGSRFTITLPAEKHI